MDIYTDGSCSPNPGKGGYAAVFLPANTYIMGSADNTTSSRMELTAVIEALKSIMDKKQRLRIITDSNYVKQGITVWIKTWVHNGWYTTAGKPVKNRDLWEELYNESQKHTIEWCWVKGHDKNQHNNRVDELAVKARKGYW